MDRPQSDVRVVLDQKAGVLEVRIGPLSFGQSQDEIEELVAEDAVDQLTDAVDS